MKNPIREKNPIRAFLVGYTMLSPLAALAQTMEPGEGDSQPGVREEIEEIIVTATKQARDVQGIPMQISVFDDDYLQNNKIQEFSDLSTSIPNLVVPDGVAGATVVAIRGISSPARTGAVAEQPVGIFSDGVFAPSGSLDLLLFDTERVEVIRGPQGAIWGRNTLAGAISFVSKRPTDELHAYIRAAGGSTDFFEVRGALSGPIIEDRLNARIAVAHDQRDGFTDRVAGGTAGSIDRYAVRGSFEFTPNEAITITLIGQYDENKFSNITPEYFTGPFAVAAGTDGFQRVVDTDFFEPSSTEAYGFTTLVEWKLGNLLLSSVSGYRNLKANLQVDADASPDFLINEFFTSNADQISQELRLSNDRAPDGLIDWMFGFEYYNRDDFVDAGSILGPALLGLPPGAGVGVEAVTLDNNVTSVAGFGTFDFHLADWLTVNTGLRFAHERKKNMGTLALTLQLTGMPDIPLFALTSPERELTDDQFSPFAGVSIKPAENVLLYANWGRGRKSGGFNDIRATQTTFGAEVGDSYEIGLKSSLMDGRVVFNSSLFLIDYSNMQIRSFEGLVPIFINAGKATSKGFEADLSVEATDGLRLIGSVGYLDAEFDEFISPTGVDLSGNRLPNAPDWGFNIAGDYTQIIDGIGELYGYAEASYTGDHFLDFANDPDGLQGGYVLVNARVGLRLESGIGVAIWGRNLTDRDYRVDFQGDLPAVLFMGSKHQVLGAPRTYGVEVEFEF